MAAILVLVPSVAEGFIAAKWDYEFDGCRWKLEIGDGLYTTPWNATTDKNGACATITAYIQDPNEFHRVGPTQSDYVTAQIQGCLNGQRIQVRSNVVSSRHFYSMSSGWKNYEC